MQIQHDVFAAQAELKFLENEPEGTFGGLGAVFGNEDSHKDVILQGAFQRSLAQYAQKKSMPRMFVEHSAWKGGDPLPVGVWDTVQEEAGGLRVKGRLIGTDHPDVRRVADLMRAGELKGLSIAFPTPAADDVIQGRRQGEPRRTLKHVNVLSIDIVGDPSNPLARIDHMKSVLVQVDQQAACTALANAMQVHRDSMSGGNSPTIEQRSALLTHLQAAHFALTGQPMPDSMKSAFGTTIRDFEEWLHRHPDDGGMGFSNTKAREIGNLVFKSTPRDEGTTTQPIDKDALNEMRALGDFSLPSF